MSAVTACLITKNERHNLRHCILTLVERVQEIVIVDTGSDDGTYDSALSLAEKKPEHIFGEDRGFPMKVSQIEWKGFDHARNKSLELASNDWCFIIDLDERLLPGHDLDDIVADAASFKPEFTFILGDIYNVLDGGEAVVRQVRLFNKNFCHYIEDPARKIHNQLHTSGQGPPKAYYGIRHYGYTGRAQKAKFESRKKMIEEWLGKEPNNFLAKFYYARHIVRQDPVQAEFLLNQVIGSREVPDRLRPSIYAYVYEAAIARKAPWKEIVEIARKGIEMFPHHPDAYWIAAWAYSSKPGVMLGDIAPLNQAAFYGVKYLEKSAQFKDIARLGEESRFPNNQTAARDLVLGAALELGLKDLAHAMVDQIIAPKNSFHPANDNDNMWAVTGVKENEDGLQEIQIGKKEEGD